MFTNTNVGQCHSTACKRQPSWYKCDKLSRPHLSATAQGVGLLKAHAYVAVNTHHSDQ